MKRFTLPLSRSPVLPFVLALLALAFGMLALATISPAHADNSQVAQQATATPTPAPVLTFTKVAAAYDVAPGDFVSYTLTVTNSGNADAKALHIQDPLPAGVVWFIGTDTVGCALNGTLLVCGPFDVGRRHLNEAEDDFVNGSVSVTVYGIAPAACGPLANAAILVDATGKPIATARSTISVRCPATATPTPTLTPTPTPTRLPPTEAPSSPTQPRSTPTEAPTQPPVNALTPKPPNTGSGIGSSRTADLGMWLFGGLGAGTLAFGLAGVYVSRRSSRGSP